VAVPLGETVSSPLWRFYYVWHMCCICIYLFIRSILYAVRPNRPPLPQKAGAIGGLVVCAVHSTPPSPSRVGGWAGVVYAVRHNNNIYYILRMVAYAKPLHSRHVESCTYNTRQVQSVFFWGW